MKFYYLYSKVYNNNELIWNRYIGKILTDDDVSQGEEYNLTWENLNETLQEISCAVNFNIWNFKKGRRISFFNSSLFDKK